MEKKDSKYLKKIIQSKKIVLIKTDATAILVRKKRKRGRFFSRNTIKLLKKDTK